MAKRFHGVDAGYPIGTVKVFTDEQVVREFDFDHSDRFMSMWGALVIDIDPVKCTTTVFFGRLPVITSMGRRSERKVEY